ncbi:hypothetical protein V6N11_069209 [Hibiscus sabdariffa]|uniref:Uncharacterized protein n=2 Tax=Hibiscus sabdariffa TaxID=183260 RepID=A0ABR2AFM7_9ROSI
MKYCWVKKTTSIDGEMRLAYCNEKKLGLDWGVPEFSILSCCVEQSRAEHRDVGLGFKGCGRSGLRILVVGFGNATEGGQDQDTAQTAMVISDTIK